MTICTEHSREMLPECARELGTLSALLEQQGKDISEMKAALKALSEARVKGSFTLAGEAVRLIGAIGAALITAKVITGCSPF